MRFYLYNILQILFSDSCIINFLALLVQYKIYHIRLFVSVIMDASYPCFRQKCQTPE